jgi:hypothetical protein
MIQHWKCLAIDSHSVLLASAVTDLRHTTVVRRLLAALPFPSLLSPYMIHRPRTSAVSPNRGSQGEAVICSLFASLSTCAAAFPPARAPLVVGVPHTPRTPHRTCAAA